MVADRNQRILENVDVAAPGRMKARCNNGLAAQMIHEESYARLDMKISLVKDPLSMIAISS